jgi:hypothetical protein
MNIHHFSPLRRERNRMHAKKTRDRKKELLEISENVIIKMEKESFLLREYLGTFFSFCEYLIYLFPIF